MSILVRECIPLPGPYTIKNIPPVENDAVLPIIFSITLYIIIS